MSPSDRPENCFPARLSRKDYADDIGVAYLDLLQQLRAIHHRHAHIGDYGVVCLLLESLQRRGSALDEIHVPLLTHPMQGSPETIEDEGFIVHKEQAFGH